MRIWRTWRSRWECSETDTEHGVNSKKDAAEDRWKAMTNNLQNKKHLLPNQPPDQIIAVS